MNLQHSALHEVHHPAGRTDNQMRSAAELMELGGYFLAPVDRHHVQVGKLCEPPDLRGDLHGQFPRGRQTQRLQSTGWIKLL